VSALRYHARAYLHGHQVGGTNPSLVEALGAGNAVLAHDNRFNRWTAGEGQFFFSTAEEARARMQEILTDDNRVESSRTAARARHAEAFQWDAVLAAYEAVLVGEG
jgi:glycosyltransferase involved in cell wall biosynthesis